MFNMLVRFGQRHGHTSVPQRPASDDLGLGQWVNNQRTDYKRGKLPPARVGWLERCGFSFELRADMWDSLFRRLVAFQEAHGHTQVPATHTDQALARWVAQQRLRWRRRALTAAQCARLECIGFTKELRNDWESNFAALLLYKQRTGLCHVHSTVGQAAALPAGACNPVLARWVQKQREAVARGELDAPRAARLRRVGFGVELWARDWQRWFEELMLFKQHTGHCAPPPPPAGGDARADGARAGLVQWVRRQRHLHRRGQLRAERRERLAALDFAFAPSAALWEHRLGELAAFHRQHGHASVPEHHPPNPPLGIWLVNQRALHRRGELPPERAARLLAAGCAGGDDVEWECSSESSTESWSSVRAGAARGGARGARGGAAANGPRAGSEVGGVTMRRGPRRRRV